MIHQQDLSRLVNGPRSFESGVFSWETSKTGRAMTLRLPTSCCKETKREKDGDEAHVHHFMFGRKALWNGCRCFPLLNNWRWCLPHAFCLPALSLVFNCMQNCIMKCHICTRKGGRERETQCLAFGLFFQIAFSNWAAYIHFPNETGCGEFFTETQTVTKRERWVQSSCQRKGQFAAQIFEWENIWIYSVRVGVHQGKIQTSISPTSSCQIKINE